jgi:hypothetical protein
MKKITAILLTSALLLAMTACDNDSGSDNRDRDRDSNNSGTTAATDNATQPSTTTPQLPSIPESPVSDFAYSAIAGGIEITKYNGTPVRVRIPDTIEGVPVISIGDRAFFQSGIMEIHIPASVTNIGSAAFAGNTGLTSVTIPDSVTALPHNAFAGVEGLSVEVRQQILRLVHAPKEIIEFAGEQWLVLENRGNQVLVLSVDILENRRFDASSNEWSSSEIRSYLNGEFMNRFSAEERAKIVDTNGDNVFLLSIDEVNSYFTDDNSRIALDSTGNAWWWWLRWSSSSSSGGFAPVVRNGDVGSNGIIVYDNNIGIRPAMWISL